jgi:hypothetical protein
MSYMPRVLSLPAWFLPRLGARPACPSRFRRHRVWQCCLRIVIAAGYSDPSGGAEGKHRLALTGLFLPFWSLLCRPPSAIPKELVSVISWGIGPFSSGEALSEAGERNSPLCRLCERRLLDEPSVWSLQLEGARWTSAPRQVQGLWFDALDAGVF